MRNELRKARARAPSAEDAVEEHNFERKVQENAKWSNVKWHCTDCKLSGEIDAVMKDGTIKEVKSNGRPDWTQYRDKHRHCGTSDFPESQYPHGGTKGMHATAKQSMASTGDQQYTQTVVQEH